MELSLLAVILGFILDLIVGDPHWLYHPIRLVGHLISGLEKLLRRIFPKTEQGELIAGGFLLVLTAGKALRLLPPLVITREEMDKGLEIMEKTLKEL